MNRPTLPDETDLNFDQSEVYRHAVISIGNQHELSDQAVVTLSARQNAIQEPQGRVLGTSGQANNPDIRIANNRNTDPNARMKVEKDKKGKSRVVRRQD